MRITRTCSSLVESCCALNRSAPFKFKRLALDKTRLMDGDFAKIKTLAFRRGDKIKIGKVLVKRKSAKGSSAFEQSIRGRMANQAYPSQPLSLGTEWAEDYELSDYELLKYALQNEKASPEILQYENDLVQRVYMQLEHQVRSFNLCCL